MLKLYAFTLALTFTLAFAFALTFAFTLTLTFALYVCVMFTRRLRCVYVYVYAYVCNSADRRSSVPCEESQNFNFGLQ